MRKTQRFLSIVAVAAGVLACSTHACAVRANWGVRMDGPRLEKAGQFEEAAFYYRGGLDFYAVIYQLWIDTAVYDPRADAIYRSGPAIFGAQNWSGQDHEERWDTLGAYIVFFNREGASRSVEAGRFGKAERARLEDRVRVYMEDLIDPDHGFGGDFSFARKAGILEGVGLFEHASYRRELAGRYAIRVCGRYYAAVANEMERAFGDAARAKLYRDRAAWWRERGFGELHLANGDRVLERLKGQSADTRLDRADLVAVLRKGLAGTDLDGCLASVRILADMNERAALEDAMRHPDASVRRTAAGVLAQAHVTRPGVEPGVLVEYFSGRRQTEPAKTTVLAAVDTGLKFQANFPKAWYDLIRKPEVFPPNATGPFVLRITGKVYVPADGRYRFYVKSDAANRTVMSLATPGGLAREIISPANDTRLQYVTQSGMRTHRIDFSQEIDLKRGFADVAIVHSGDELRKIENEHLVRISGEQKAGIQLYWSSDERLTEPVPAANLSH